MRILTIFLIALTLTGCEKECKPPLPIVVIETKYVDIPVKCKVTQVKCKEAKGRVAILTELIRCNYVLKQANKECE